MDLFLLKLLASELLGGLDLDSSAQTQLLPLLAKA